MANSAQGIARDLALGLLEQQWQPRHISPSRAEHPQALLELCLHESIALRESGWAKLSLELLQAVQQRGLQSPWLLDNQARALVQLGQRQAAFAIWERLLAHSDASVAAVAREMVATLERELVEALEGCCRRHGWILRQLRRPDNSSLLIRVLEELIASREAGQPRLSLELAREAQRQGWSDPWIRDNEARALVHLRREAEAVAIWREQRHSTDQSLAEAATSMLSLYEADVEAAEQAEQLESLKREGRLDEAERLLIERLFAQPDNRELLCRLGQLIAPETHTADDLLNQELAEDRQILAGLNRVAAAVGASVGPTS